MVLHLQLFTKTAILLFEIFSCQYLNLSIWSLFICGWKFQLQK